MKVVPSSKIYVASSRIPNAGRGVFAGQTIHAGDVIERCPVIILKSVDVSLLRETDLLNYYFKWGGEASFHRAALCLGFGELYNHSYTPNALYEKKYDEQVIEFVALQDISLNEEITVNYNGEPTDRSFLWMADIPQKN